MTEFIANEPHSRQGRRAEDSFFLFFPFIFDDTFKKKEEHRCFLLQNRRFLLHCCLPIWMHGAPIGARSRAGRGVAASLSPSLIYHKRNGEEKGREGRSDGLWWRSSPRAALTDACWEAKWAKRSARMLPPPHKADAALSWEFVSDTDQTHFI